MRVLVTGHNGYIGSVLTRMLEEAGQEVDGVDSYWFEPCTFGEVVRTAVPPLKVDIRDLERRHLEGFEAVIHLAALSNDPLGDLDRRCTYDINFHASVRLAKLAREAGVSRFLFSSSCSLYGVSGDDFLTEEAPFRPVTPYGETKVLVEKEVALLADSRFSPTFLRNATAYGVSSRLRADLVVNNLVGFAHATGEVLLKSDGSPWRPLVHVEDISRAFLAVLEAPRDLVHNQAFNVGRTGENYRVGEVAEMVRNSIPGSAVRCADGAGPDPRCYRVNCDKIARTLPAFKPRWTVEEGIAELREAYRRHRLTLDDLLGPRYTRIRHIRKLLSEGQLAPDLRWKPGSLPRLQRRTALRQ